MSGEGPRISVIVPARNEEASIVATLVNLREREVLEVIVVDGGSSDQTLEVAAPYADAVLEAPPGRAVQMNAGARRAGGDLLFFLHADTRVPAGFARAIVAACDLPGVIGGRFDVDLDAPGLAFRVISYGINLRSRMSGIFTGDQGLFIRREAFERLGGYPELPLLEDLAMSIAMKRAGRIVSLHERLRTSARRWQQQGTVRTVLRMWAVRALYAAGVSPGRLARWY